MINLLDRISRKIFRVTCIPTQRLVPTYNIRFGFKASNRGRKTNPRRESAGRKRFNSMKSRHERVFSPLLDLFTFQRSSLEPEIDEKIEVSRESARLSRTFNDNKMARRSADVSYSFPIRLRFPLSRKRHECDLEMTCNSWTSFSFFIFFFLHFFLSNYFKNRIINYYYDII